MLRIILLLKWKSLKAQLQYNESFAVQMISVSFVGFLRFPALLILTSSFGDIGGWSIWDLTFLIALVQMAHGVHHALFFQFYYHRRYVRLGELDRLLVRPVHPILQLMAASLPMAALGEFIPGAVMLVAASAGADLVWSLFDVVFLGVAILSGAVIEGALDLFFATFDFWFEQANLQWLPDAFREAPALYPVHIYGPFLLFALTFIFPFAFVAYYPAHHFLGREVPIYGQALVYLAPVVAAVSMAIAVAFWSVGLRRYQSSGT